DVGEDLFTGQRGVHGVGDQVGVVAAALDGLAHARGGNWGFPHGSILPSAGRGFHIRTDSGSSPATGQRSRRGPTSGRGPVTGRTTARAPSTTAPVFPTSTGSRSSRATSGSWSARSPTRMRRSSRASTATGWEPYSPKSSGAARTDRTRLAAS